MQGLTAVLTMVLALAVPAAQPDQWPLGGLLRTRHERIIVDALLPWIIAVPFVPALTARAGTMVGFPEAAVVVASALAPTLVLLGALGVAVRQQQRLGAQLTVALADVEQTIEQSPIGIAIIGTDSQYLHANDSLCRLLGRDRATLLDAGWQHHMHPDDRGAEQEHVRACLRGHIRRFRVSQRFQHADGRWIPTEVSASLVRDADGAPLHFVAQLVDMTEHHQIRERLQDAAVRDMLTGLANRRGVEQHLARLVASRDGGAVGIVYIDLDRFKEVNDTYGHAAGDEVLRAVGRRLQDLVRTDDIVARIGGDEFVIVCSAPDPRAIDDVTERVRVALADGIEVPVGPDVVVRGRGSAGSVMVDVDEQLADALERADRAMYEVKRARTLDRA
jgi:diguanylate cyclase (GGDEF)-like protein/PAS domain S-box-containing protein